MTLRVFSYGGGVQSTAALVLAAQGRIDFKTFLFCNVGADSENPKTLAYLNEVAKPYAQAHGLEIIELQKTSRDGTPVTIYQKLMRPGTRSIGIPVRMNGNGAPGRRSCTADFKILVVDKWLREHGAKVTDAQVGLGISLDEIHRMKPNMDPDTIAWKENVFPLLTEIPRPFTRIDCVRHIEQAGLIVPPESSCVFCPFHTKAKWQRMRQEEPEQFWHTANLEAHINRVRADLGLDPVWISSWLKPLADATTELHQDSLFDEPLDTCESGYCMI